MLIVFCIFVIAFGGPSEPGMVVTQDMPPPGGFADINVKRTFAKPMLRQGIWFLIAAGLTLNGFVYIKEFKRRLRIMRIEQTEHYIAAMPFIYAEQERLFLKHLRSLREEERDLMKDHRGWKQATLYGEPVYKTLPKDYLPPLSVFDYTVHRSQMEWITKVGMPDFHS